MGIIINGMAMANQIREELKTEISKLKEKGVTPALYIILVGNNPASEIYVRVKEKYCKEIGIDFELERLSEKVTEKELIEKVKKLNSNKTVNGIIVQLPLPGHINKNKAIETIDPEKDVDALTPLNLGKLVSGRETLSAATSKGIVRLLEKTGIKLAGKHVVIINRSLNVGRPLAFLLLNRDATVTVCHSKTAGLEKFTKIADIVVCAVGKPGFLKREMVKKGSVIVDVGLTYVNGKGFGDVDFENVKKKASYITPVPGGIGPITVAMILENTVIATKTQMNLSSN